MAMMSPFPAVFCLQATGQQLPICFTTLDLGKAFPYIENLCPYTTGKMSHASGR
jgi:hypothetical protein